MTGTRPAELLRHLEAPGEGDRALVGRFAEHCDQAAFAELIRRHGPMVLAACLRVARHRQDAEDAFQAVFLVFVRRCAAIRSPELVGNWLYGVAVRVAMKARRSAARRRAREVQVPTMPDPPDIRGLTPPGSLDAGEINPILDEELAALPAWYREAILLCDLRGASREDAARLLGIPEGTLSSRLTNGRKKLAARLAKRGVAFSVAAIPATLASAARAAVPAELVVKVCGVAGGAAIPIDITRLASGGFTMTRKVLLGVAGAALIAVGGVLATQQVEPPKTADPPRTVSAEKTKSAVDGEEKVTLTSQPRMSFARDYKLGSIQAIAWSPDGKVFALDGHAPAKVGSEHVIHLAVVSGNREEEDAQFSVASTAHLVGFAPGGTDLVIEQRERGLVSGFHRLKYFAVKPGANGLAVEDKTPRTVNLDAGDTYGYAFAADGKSFRTLSIVTSARGVIQKIVVSSVDAATGRTQKVLMTAEGEFQGYGLSPQGERLAVITIEGNVEVFDVDSGKKLWSKENFLRLRVDPTQRPPLQLTAAFSPDARRLVVCGQRVIPTVLNAATGESLPKLENLEMVDAYPSPASFSSDGRLLVLYGSQYVATTRGGGKLKESVSWNLGNQLFLRVWDTATGKLLRQWNQAPTGVAFHPSKPILAIVERNGENLTRVGLWDFVAEPAKK